MMSPNGYENWELGNCLFRIAPIFLSLQIESIKSSVTQIVLWFNWVISAAWNRFFHLFFIFLFLQWLEEINVYAHQWIEKYLNKYKFFFAKLQTKSYFGFIDKIDFLFYFSWFRKQYWINIRINTQFLFPFSA